MNEGGFWRGGAAMPKWAQRGCLMLTESGLHWGGRIWGRRTEVGGSDWELAGGGGGDNVLRERERGIRGEEEQQALEAEGGAAEGLGEHSRRGGGFPQPAKPSQARAEHSLLLLPLWGALHAKGGEGSQSPAGATAARMRVVITSSHGSCFSFAFFLLLPLLLLLASSSSHTQPKRHPATTPQTGQRRHLPTSRSLIGSAPGAGEGERPHDPGEGVSANRRGGQKA